MAAPAGPGVEVGGGVVGVVTGPCARAAGASASAGEATRMERTVFTREFPFLGTGKGTSRISRAPHRRRQTSRTTPPVLPRYADGLTPRCPRHRERTGADHHRADG